MTINANVAAQNAGATLQSNQAMLNKSLARLSTGSKIVNPADDAAGMAVATRLDAQVNRISAAQNNVGDATSFSQTPSFRTGISCQFRIGSGTSCRYWRSANSIRSMAIPPESAL